MVESVSVLLVSIAAVLTAIDQISIVLTTKKLWRQQQQLLQQLEIPYKGTPNSVFDNFKDGALQRRRYYGNDGRKRKDEGNDNIYRTHDHEGSRQKHSSRTEEIQSIFRSDEPLQKLERGC